MQAVIMFSIQNDLLPNLHNLTNFFSKFGMFCIYYPCWCCDCFFQAIGSVLANMQNVFNDTAGFFCMDVATIGYKANGERDYVNSPFAIVKNKRGIFIFFHRNTQQTLFMGYSERFYFTNGGPGRVAQLINGDDNTISDYLQKNMPNVTINDCSIFFLCLEPALYAMGIFNQSLAKLNNLLVRILNPKIR